jgi:hypothetical protein
MACYAIVEAVSFGPERDNRFAIRISLLPFSALSEYTPVTAREHFVPARFR